jgi:hypothetical protein
VPYGSEKMAINVSGKRISGDFTAFFYNLLARSRVYSTSHHKN